MWIYLVGIIVELAILGILSSRLTQLSFTMLMRLTRSRSIAITILTIILFPGTVIHELSHLFTAEILGVQTGKLTLAPESIEGEDVQSGSVQIAVSDPFRRTLIGIAPTITGVISLSILSWYLSQTQMLIIWIALLYLILTISNTMFTSKEDLKGVLPVALTIAIFTITFYVSGIRIMFPTHIAETISVIIQSLAHYLAIAVAVNLIGILVSTLFLLLLQKRQS
ncbi:MAG: putative membrane protein [Microgenomates group bacterium GW2011_GWB1_40_9]|nr:MAG: seg [Microgenomates group bacterium GW2011_GWC1_39_12]KKR79394.1 MAG: putative membrane protein [Microgenomates group bacterium GW2011_GWB1_40_9]